MKKQKHEYRRVFQGAERIVPSPGLWRHIAAKTDLRAGRQARVSAFQSSPWLRLAASVVLAVGLLGLGISLKPKVKHIAPSAATVAVAEGAEQSDLVDPELLGWHADLGEVDMEAEEAEEVL